MMRRRRRQRQAGAVAAQGGLSAKSVIRAKSIAASILNMSESDLADIMDTDQVRVNMSRKTLPFPHTTAGKKALAYLE